MDPDPDKSKKSDSQKVPWFSRKKRSSVSKEEEKKKVAPSSSATSSVKTPQKKETSKPPPAEDPQPEKKSLVRERLKVFENVGKTSQPLLHSRKGVPSKETAPRSAPPPPKSTAQTTIPPSTQPRSSLAPTGRAASGTPRVPTVGKTPKSTPQTGAIAQEKIPPKSSLASAGKVPSGTTTSRDTTPEDTPPQEIIRPSTPPRTTLAGTGEAAEGAQRVHVVESIIPKYTTEEIISPSALPRTILAEAAEGTQREAAQESTLPRDTAQEIVPPTSAPVSVSDGTSQVDISKKEESTKSSQEIKKRIIKKPPPLVIQIEEPSSSQEEFSKKSDLIEHFEEGFLPPSLPVVGTSPTSLEMIQEIEPSKEPEPEPPKIPYKYKGKSITGKSTKSSKKKHIPPKLTLDGPPQLEELRRSEISESPKSKALASPADVLLWWKSEPGCSYYPYSPAYLPRCEPIPGFFKGPDVDEPRPGTSKDPNGWSPEEEHPIDASFPEEFVTEEIRPILDYANTYLNKEPELAKILIDQLKLELTYIPRRIFPLRSYVEVDAEDFFTEILEFFSYSEEPDLTEFKNQFIWYLSEFGLPNKWTLLSEEKRNFLLSVLKREVQTRDYQMRNQAAECILYIALGCWDDFITDSQQEANLKVNSILLYRNGFFKIFVDLLKRETRKIREAENFERTDFLVSIVGVLYMILETMRWINEERFRYCKQDLDWFLIDLLSDSKEDKNMLIVTLFDLIDTLTSCKVRVQNFPFKKVLLLLWKSLLFILGSSENLERKMKQDRRDLSPRDTTITQEKDENANLDVNQYLKKTFEKYINVPSPTTADVPFSITSKIDVMLRNLYEPLKTEGVASDPEIATNMTELIFRAMYPRLRVYIASLLRVMCFIIHTKETREFMYIRVPSAHYTKELKFVDQQRYKEIISKATLAIIKLLMIHTKVNSPHAYRHICETLHSLHFASMATFLYRDFYSLITDVLEGDNFVWQKERRLDLDTYNFSRRNMFTCTTFMWILTNYIRSCSSVPEELQELKVWMWSNLRRSFFIDNVTYKKRVLELIMAMERGVEGEWRETLVEETNQDQLHWDYRMRMGRRRQDRVIELLITRNTIVWCDSYKVMSDIFDLWLSQASYR